MYRLIKAIIFPIDCLKTANHHKKNQKNCNSKYCVKEMSLVLNLVLSKLKQNEQINS